MKDKVLFIGLGNTLRGDDGVGWALTQELLARGYQCRQYRDDLTALLDDFKKWDKVIIVDAMEDSHQPVGAFHIFETKTLDEMDFGSSTHSISLRKTLEMAEVLGCLPGRLLIYAVNGSCFEIGQSLNPSIDVSAHAKNLEALCMSLE